MHHYHLILLTMAALLGICTGATASTDSTIAAADVPVVGLSTKKPYGVTAKRPTKASAATNTGNEDRGNAANLIQAGTSKLDDLVTSANLETFKFLVNNLQLGDDFAASLRSSQLKNLNTFVSSYRRTRDSEKHISLIAPLTAKYGDDAVAKALVKLERDTNTPPEMATLVQQLRSEQLTYWLQNGKSGYDVFKLLKLEDDGYEVLHRLKFQALEDYITRINSEKTAGETMLNVLTKAFGDESKLVPLIETAKSRRRSMMKGFELEAALLAKWRSDDLPLNEIWVRLKIGNNVYDALKSAELRLFSKYVSKYYPTNEKAVVEMLIATYGDVCVAKALVIAKTKATTADIAAKLQVQQLEGWLSSQRSANDVFKLLKIEEDGLRFVNSPKWEILSEFIKVFNSNKNPEDMTDMFTVLRSVYRDDGKFALMLSKEQTSGVPMIAKTAIQYREVLLEEWIRSDIKPTDIYRKFFNGKEGIQEKKIVARYTEYYDEEMDIPVHALNNPRRS